MKMHHILLQMAFLFLLKSAPNVNSASTGCEVGQVGIRCIQAVCDVQNKIKLHGNFDSGFNVSLEVIGTVNGHEQPEMVTFPPNEFQMAAEINATASAQGFTLFTHTTAIFNYGIVLVKWV